MIDGLLGGKESCRYAVIHILSFETNPMTFPTGSGTRVIGMPFSREKKKHVASFDRCLWTMSALEDTLTLGIVEQLVFI